MSEQNEAEIRIEKLRNSLRWALMELGEIGGGGGRTTASDYSNEDFALSFYVFEGELFVETCSKKRGLASDIHIVSLDPGDAVAWLVGALRVVHSHLGGGR